jgi:hypothetical protein
MSFKTSQGWHVIAIAILRAALKKQLTMKNFHRRRISLRLKK